MAKAVDCKSTTRGFDSHRRLYQFAVNWSTICQMQALKNSRKILFVQLPIPPAGPTTIVGNVPLAAGYLILWARKLGLDSDYTLEILPTAVSNYFGDLAIVEAILERRPCLVGFSCYLWNIDRTLWIAAKLKSVLPELQIVVGGPEITADNSWVLQSDVVDYAVIGEGEQTFTELLSGLKTDSLTPIAGLWRRTAPNLPAFRKPLPNLDQISSPYLAGILDAADERMLMLETIRGCVFKCKFCYYPKSYDGLYFLSEDKIVANLAHARQRGATEIVLLDPTLNQRKDFDDFLRLLARENSDRQFTFFGELRAEGIKLETARLLRQANFTEVEIGLQSIDPQAQSLMDRKNNLKAFERGVEAMLDAGLTVKVDLIIGLPGDTVSSVKRGFEYLAESQLFSTVQVFNLAILPGTAFRQEAGQLGLSFQPKPPYYVLETPTLTTENLFDLMAEAQEVFQSEWDPFPPPRLAFTDQREVIELVKIDLNRAQRMSPAENSDFFLPPAHKRAQAMTVWFHGHEFASHRIVMQQLLSQVLADCPHTTLQIVLEPTGNPYAISPSLAAKLLSCCYENPNYLDRYYSLNPTGLLGSKRLLVCLPADLRPNVDLAWLDSLGESATIVWRGGVVDEADLAEYEISTK